MGAAAQLGRGGGSPAGTARCCLCRLRLVVPRSLRLALLLAAAAALLGVAHTSKRPDEASFPEDTESERRRWRSYADLSDDEDLLADEASGDGYGSGENGSGTVSPESLGTIKTLVPTVYFRALVNFTKSIDYSPNLDDVNSEEFRDVSEAVVDTLESEYYKIPGDQVVSVVFIKEVDGYIFVELDVGSEGNVNEEQIRKVLYSVIESGSIASYVTSTVGFRFRRLGTVTPVVRACTEEEFTCQSGECVPKEYLCDQRPDCRDMSDELDCAEPGPPECAADEFSCDSGQCVRLLFRCNGHPDCGDASDEDGCESTTPRPPVSSPRPGTTRVPVTTSPVTTRRAPATPPPRAGSPKPPLSPELRPCRKGEATCSNKQCIPRDFVCDGERDCQDGSDELNCGTPSPCEPNEFRCRNGHCALKLWRCDGDNDCTDGSDELNCPTKRPGDTCGPEQFTCVFNRTCIPASYQCDDETDCEDRSDEIGCTPPQVITPPEDSIEVAPGETARFTCVAVGVPTPIITWRLNWGHIPSSHRVSITSENGRGTLVIQDVREEDQGAYTCEAINARGMVFGIPDGVLSLTPGRGPCPEGHFHIQGTSQCLPCFCFGVTKACRSTSRYRNQIRLRFDTQDDFKGVNVTTPSQPGTPPLSSTQLQIDPSLQEFQLVDLSRRFVVQDSFWALPGQFLGNKVDSYGGFLRFKVRYGLGRGLSDPVQKPNVVIVGNGQKLIYRVQVPTQPSVVNQRQIQFTEENWEKESGAPVSREELLLTLQNLEAILIQTVYDTRMASVGLSDIVMDTTTVEVTDLGVAQHVEECRCPVGYSGLSCERCDPNFKRVPGGPYLGTCSGCSCNGHSSTCDPFSGYCLNCKHNTEGPRCNQCKAGFFGDATEGTPTACRPCPCPYTEAPRRFSSSCFLDTDGQATCDACAPGYTGRRCEKCAPGYQGDPIRPGGQCVKIGQEIVACDERGSSQVSDGACKCKPNVTGRQCNECVTGTFHLSGENPEGCLRCFCMGLSRQCASSSWNRDQVRVAHEDAEKVQFSLSNPASTHSVSEGIRFTGASELTFSSFHTLPRDVYYWTLPESFKGDKVTSYGGELRYTVTHHTYPGSPLLRGQPDVLLQGNGIFLEHRAATSPLPGTPTTFTVPFREQAWRRADGQNATREHLLMALADVDVFMIRASYSEQPQESRISGIHMDVAVPHPTGLDPALEVEDCTCPPGYRGPSCQNCDVGYTRTTSGLYLGTCEPCDCSGHSTECDAETGDCQNCQHDTEGTRCERCQPGFFGDAHRGTPGDCRPCPCYGPHSASQHTCFVDTDGHPTCDSCAPGYAGRQCERCAPGYVGNPSRGQPCSDPGSRCRCDPHGSLSSQCDAGGQCQCKANVEGPSCSTCRPHHFHLSAENPEGCLPCFCMGVTQQCTSSSYYRDLVTSPFSPGDFQGFALVNRQRSIHTQSGFVVETSPEGPQLSYGHLGHLGQESYYWQLPEAYLGDKVGSYGARLRYTLSYNAGGRGTPLPDADVQITGNDITLVAHQPELQPHERRSFEVVFREQFWKRPDGQPATREHLMMALADLDEILIRATYTTDMVSASITGVSLETAVPGYTSLPRALEVEECRCPPGYQGLSCQDCATGYTRTGGGLYLGHCALCECNGHSESCHPETGACSSCLHHTAGEFCELCAPGYYGDSTAGTPEDCQPCACPLLDPQNQFSRTCESLGGGGYRCTACQPGYTGQYCEQCAPGYTGNPNAPGQKCVPLGRPDQPPFVVQIHPTRTTVSQGSEVTLRCHVSGAPPHYFYWSREDGRPVPGTAQRLHQGLELYFPSIQPSEAGVYLCTCRNPQYSNTSRAEIVVTETPSKPITVTIEEQKVQTVKPGSDVTFVCTAKSKSPAYTLVWTRQNNGKLPSRAMDFNGILTLRNVQPEDAGIYVCTGSNMFDMDEGIATLYVQAPSKTQMFYGPVEVVEGHRPSAPSVPPMAVIEPSQLSVQPGQPAEFRCVATGSPEPTMEWIGGQGGIMSPKAIIQGGILRFPAAEPSDESQYLCRVRNSAGQHMARAFLQVHSATVPQVQVSPERTEVHEGSTVRLYCRAAGSPAATITWEKQGGSLPPQSRTERTDIATLVIPSITVADGGVYHCVGSSAAGTGRARIEVVVIQASGISPAVKIESSSSSVVEGQTLDLTCVVAGHPAASVLWYRRGGALPANHQVYGPVLRILQVSAADSGEYVCRVSNGAGPKEASITVSVQQSHPSSPHETPPVQIESPSSSYTEGQDVDLMCRITGLSRPRVSWYKRGGALPANHKMSGYHLRILQATAADSGEYVCRVTDDASAVVQEASVVVTIYSTSQTSGIIPPLRIESSSASIAEGQTLDLNCVVAGQEGATITWYKRGGSLPASHQVSGSRLRIPQVSAADSGEYVCRIRQGSVVREVSVIVSRNGSPSTLGITSSMRIEASSPSIAEGQTLELDCIVARREGATVTWYRRGGALPANHQTFGSRLRLVKVTPEDSGEYVCRVSYEATTQEASVFVTIQEGSVSSYPAGVTPPVRIESSSTSPAEGHTLDLKCITAGPASQARVTWYKRGGTLPANHQVSGSILRIPQASAADSGEYVCRVSHGSVVHEASLIVTIRSGTDSSYSVGVTPPIRIETSSASVVEGQTVDLNCLVAGQAQPRVMWYKRGGALPLNSQILGSRLRILQATAADSGEYICYTSDGGTVLEASIIVSIPSSSASTFPSGVVPPVRIESSSSSLAEGQTLELNCIVAGQSQPKVTWFKRDGPLPPNHQISGTRLRIPQVTSANSGEYVCRVSGTAVTQEAVLVVTIQDSEGPSPSGGTAPLLRIESSSPSVTEGQTLDLMCIAPSQPHATFTWYRREGPLPTGHRISNGRLRLSQLTSADSGEYVCRVTGGAPPQEASYVVSVTGTSTSASAASRLQSPIISIEPHSTAVRQGADISFKCRVHDGALPIEISWKLPNNQPLDNVQISPNGSMITISNAHHQNQGSYRCVASNRFGIANSVVNLMVQGPPTISVVPKGPVQVKVGKSLSLDCLGTGEPRALVRWSKVGVRQKVEHQTLLPQESRAVLQISSAKLEDAGTYVCLAQNSLGTAEAQVDVSVEAVHGKPGAPEVRVNPTQTVVTGQTARLHCSATGDPPPTIHWSKLRAPLPWQHQVVNETLVIPRVAMQDSGQYICNATNSAGFTEAFIMLDVEAPPYATSHPDSVSVQAGDTVQLECLAHGTPPLHYEWTKVNGSLSRHVVVREGVLHISPTTPHDSGTYRCHVRNRVGSTEALAQVRVQGQPGGPPSIQVTPLTDAKAVGGTAEFVCSVAGDPQARIEWFKKDGELPKHHSISNGVLRIEKLDRGCQGVYVCRVSGPTGEAQESVRLTVQALPKVMINIRTTVQTVLVGSAVEFECLAFGDPKPNVAWSKVGGQLRPEVLVSGSTVKIERVEQSDAGQYRCTATNDVGAVQSHVILHVQSLPQIAAQPEMKEVSVGSTVVFPCSASGFPVPDIAWTKLEGDLPASVRLEGNVLTIPSAHPEDSGIYVCTASNRQGKVTAFSMLKVRERVVPYFTQNPQSYLVLPTMKDAYKTFAIEITFRPDTPDGMLVYNGQKKNTGTDFVSFGLVGGRPELRFDAGSGMATIRHPSLIKLGEFHTVRLYRNLTQGSLVLDNLPPVNGTSQGKFQGLDLNEGLYLGGYPNYAAVAKTGLSSGFIGCVRQLIIQGREVIFKDFDLQALGVSNCPTCNDQPCQNGGVCRDSESSSYVCECPPGFAGSNCEHPQALRCHPEACGPDATCVNRATGEGYTCRCLLGKYGEKCMDGVTVSTPFFQEDDAFISYPPLTNIHYELRVDVEIKPLSPDGLVLFSGGEATPVADFASLNMVNSFLEFRYELGSGTAVLQSRKPLELGQWHKVTAERFNKDGTLHVNDERPVKRSSPGKSQGLNLRTAMYLGGVDDRGKVPAAANVSSHFHGCIGEVSINGKKVDISYSFLDSRGVSQCVDSSPCDRRPCQHGGKCLLTGEYEFQCLCLDGYKGERCEISEVQCRLQRPCLNGGVCKDTQCVCPRGFLGLYCEHDASQHPSGIDWTTEGSGGNDAPGQYGAYFHDGGYLALPRHAFPRSLPDSPETIELEVRTGSPNGLLLWQGVATGEESLGQHVASEEEGESGKAKDFISLGLKDGHLLFSYQLGSGEANLLSEDPVDDGEWHRVTAIREGKKGFLQVDGDEVIAGESPGKNIMVNTKGRIYVGGAPNIKALTAGKYASGITGCIKNLVLINDRPNQQPQQPVDLQHHSEAGRNTQECPS